MSDEMSPEAVAPATILKVLAHFTNAGPVEVWDFYEGETLTPEVAAARGLTPAVIEDRIRRGYLEDTGLSIDAAVAATRASALDSLIKAAGTLDNAPAQDPMKD